MRVSVNITKGGHHMTNYREILRLYCLGLNKTQIAEICGYPRNTVVQTIKQAEANGLKYPLPEGMSDSKLAKIIRQNAPLKVAYKMPDYANVAREMLKSNVTMNLLWLEYAEECKENGEIPYQLTQFKKYYRDYMAKTRATMHLDHKPGEVMQVDWAGNTASIIDTDTGESFRVYLCSNFTVQRLFVCGRLSFHKSGVLDRGACERLQILWRRC